MSLSKRFRFSRPALFRCIPGLTPLTMGIPSSPGMNLLTRMELVQSVTSKLMTQALRFFSSRCSTANTSPSTVTMPMSSSSVFIGTGTFRILWVP